MDRAVVHVAAAAIFDADGRVLIARRPAHVHQGNLWEFPGGKREPGETAEAALIRELWEELHVRPTRYRPLIRIPFDYPDKRVLLDVWRVDAFTGTAVGREGQPIRWVAANDLGDYAFPAANRPIVAAVRLPERYLITGAFRSRDDFLQRLDRALAAGIRLLQLRLPPDALDLGLLREATARARAVGAWTLINGDPEFALAAGADGVHLNGERLRALTIRPLGAEKWCAASCHDDAELRRAAELGLDFAVLGPVLPTATHPGASTLGWSRFASMVADVPMPVFGLGGLGEADLPEALAARAQGVAAIRAFWGD